ncbi:MAG: imelysin family protein [Ectothiorhodospiraceae bacterium]|nr:imelysin family protein [Chromatiales bacterium]MCP5154877.1 imelysin family protein [Ectothiorhodospiraceae bacterium]
MSIEGRIVRVVAVALTAAAATVAHSAEPAAVAERVRVEHVLPGYRGLATAVDGLQGAITGACTTPPGVDAHAVRDAFDTAMDAWQSVQHLRHGPVADADRHARLQFWPDPRGRTGQHLSRLLREGRAADLEPAALRGASVAVQGFGAVEWLLEDGVGLATPPFSASAVSRCDVAAAVVRELATIAHALVEGWERPAEPGEGEARVAALVGDLATAFQLIEVSKLDAVAGAVGSRPRPRLAESWRSGRGLRNVAVNLRALRALHDLLAASVGRADPVVEAQFDRAQREVRSRGDSLVELVGAPGGQNRVRALASTIADLGQLAVTGLARGLGTGVGFNALDGD